VIHLSDLVKIKENPPRHRGRQAWIGIVTDVRSSAVGQTITVLWPEEGLEESWTAEALEVVSAEG